MPRTRKKTRRRVKVERARQGSTTGDEDALQMVERKPDVTAAFWEKSQDEVELQSWETFSCTICLEFLKNPVTIPCGHNFCLTCIITYWDDQMVCSCPQCRKTFTPRPELMKNTLLIDLLEELKKSGAVPDDFSAGNEAVVCDVCMAYPTGYPAVKSCLVCLASYCEEHVIPHYKSPVFKKHTLVEVSVELQKNICPHHNEIMKMFCRTDQALICYLCSVEEHKDHDIVSTEAETTHKKRELKLSLQQRLQVGHDDGKVLDQEYIAFIHTVDKAVEDSEKVFTELIQLLQTRSSEVKQQIRYQQEIEGFRLRVLHENLQEEINELKRREADMESALLQDYPNGFLFSYPYLSQLDSSSHTSIVNIKPLTYLKNVMAPVEKVRNQLQDVLTETRVLLPEPEPKTRAEFLRYSKEITVDPNTINTHMSLSEGNRKVRLMGKEKPNPDYKDRLEGEFQILSRESLTGRCYWEVEMTVKKTQVDIAVTYRNILKSYSFGNNWRTWCLSCYPNHLVFSHSLHKEIISHGLISRVGVYLDHDAGILSFYDVTNTMTLLLRFQTAFFEPLCVGLQFMYPVPGDTAKFCKLR